MVAGWAVLVVFFLLFSRRPPPVLVENYFALLLAGGDKIRRSIAATVSNYSKNARPASYLFAQLLRSGRPSSRAMMAGAASP